MEEKKKKFEISLKDVMETEEYRRNRESINSEINKYKVDVNYKEFAKDVFEKRRLIKEKLAYKLLKENKVQYNNSLQEVFSAFSNAKLPNWGGLSINGQIVTLVG